MKTISMPTYNLTDNCIGNSFQNSNKKQSIITEIDAPLKNMGCVIMASGLGTRFGKNKLMADFNGRPLISYILDATSHIFQKRVVVTRHKDIAALCHKINIDVILHDLPYQSDTIRLGLEKMLDTQHCMFCTADQPLLKQDTVLSLALSAVNHPLKIHRPISDNIPGSPVIFPQWTYEELLHLPQDLGGSYVIKQHPTDVQYLSGVKFYELKDIDTCKDFICLQELSQRL